MINSGAQAQLTITVPSFLLKATKIGVDGNMVIWNIEADDTTILKSDGTSPVTVTAVNAVAAYLGTT